ncbi:MAG: Formyl-CoA:oxalate CoA-transferase [Pseudorhodoplanes sp.]|nr:Formyl-CoA:oxalate CoA-transferase [Pseudorhodoplanes sp.]
MMPAAPANPQDAALPPYLVAELGQRVGAAVCGALLAQLGMTVIAVEDADAHGKSRFSRQLAAGKLRWRRSGGDDALMADLAAAADVVLLSSDLDGAGRPAREAQIVCDITACGSDGPLAGAPLSDVEIQALAGILHTNGLPDGMPVVCPVPIVEYLAGLNAAAAVIAGLRVRRKSGTGQEAEVALYDCGFAAMSSLIARLFGANAAADVGRIGNRHGLSSPWNVFRARDGWVQICTGSDDQWQRFCQVIGRAELAQHPDFASSVARVANNAAVDAAVQAWIVTQTVEGCIAALTAASIAGGAIVPVDQYPREPNLDYRGMIGRADDGVYVPASPLRMNRTPGRAPGVPTDADRAMVEGALRARGAVPAPGSEPLASPLAGIRVLEIGHYTTAPAAARMFAALGADVIKIEPPEGEAARAWPPIDRGQSTFYTVTNSGKRSVVLDLGSAAGRDRLRALIAQSDVLIENMKPGALARRGFGADEIAAINPRMIYCGISGFGADSRYPGRPAFDTVVQGMSGLMHLIRAADGTPLKTGISAADVMGAAAAVVAVLAALEERDRSTCGQSIDLSMQDIMAWATQVAWNEADFAPDTQVLRVADGAILVTGAVDAALAENIASLSRAEAVSRLRAGGGRAVAVVSPAEMMAAEHTRARGLHFTLSDERGAWPSLGVPLRLSKTPPLITRPSPKLGRDNAAVFGTLSRHAAAMPVSARPTLQAIS